MTVLTFLSFFRLSNLIKTQSPKWREGELCFRILPSLMKAIFLMHSCFVCLCFALGTFTYLHKGIAQKWRRPQVCPLLGKVLWILRKGWKKVRRREKLFVVLSLDHPFCTILVDAVKVEQRCARRPIWGRHIHFPWRPQPHGWWYLRLCFQPGEHHVVEKIVLDA